MNNPMNDQQTRDELTRKGDSDDQVLRQILDQLPIFATRLGFRTNSTQEQEEFARFLFRTHQQWLEFKAGQR